MRAPKALDWINNLRNNHITILALCVAINEKQSIKKHKLTELQEILKNKGLPITAALK